MNPRILTVGYALMDILYRVPMLPEPGNTVTVEDGKPVSLPDGAGLITAIALSKLGATSLLSCRLGQDVDGQRLYTALSDAGVDTSAVIADPRTQTGIRLYLTDGQTLPRTVYYPGANLNLTRDNLETAFSTRPEALCLHLDANEEILLDAAARAAEKHLPIFLNLSEVRETFPYAKLPKLDILCMCDREIEALTGIRPNGSDAGLKALLALSKSISSRYYVINMGERGAFLFDGRHFSMASPFSVKPVDIAAAREAFFAALSLEYLRTRGNITAASKYATLVCALTTSRPGTVSSLPSADEIGRYGAK